MVNQHVEFVGLFNLFFLYIVLFYHFPCVWFGHVHVTHRVIATSSCVCIMQPESKKPCGWSNKMKLKMKLKGLSQNGTIFSPQTHKLS